MDSKFLKVCLMACVAAGVSACNEGVHNNLQCDSSYQSECLDGTHVMQCQNNFLVVTQCGTGQYCDGRKGACVVYSDGTNPSQTTAVCGNGTIEAGEVCEGNNVNGKTCVDFLGEGATGVVSCVNCQLNFSNCQAKQVNPVNNCGNNLIDAGEECDGTLLNNKTCADIIGAGATGTLACNPTECKFDSSACVAAQPTTPVCGNGIIETGEECDGRSFKVDVSVDCAPGYAPVERVCKADCSGIEREASCAEIPADCGNGQIDADEECDGAATNGRTCEDFLGAGATGTVGCTSICKFDVSNCIPSEEPPVKDPVCGDGYLDEGEQCDDGNLIDGDGCTSDCKREEVLPCEVDDSCDDDLCHSDAECEDAVCSHGLCVTEDMLTYKAGDPCDPSEFMEFCNGTSLVYCGRDDSGEYSVVMSDCAEYGGCAIVDVKSLYGESEAVYEAWCNNTNTDVCSEQGQKIPYCTSYSSAESGTFDYASYTLCLKNTDGGFTTFDAASQLGKYGICYDESGENLDTCNAEKTECKNPEIFECEYTTKCDGANSLLYCVDYSAYGLGIQNATYTCSEVVENSVCASVEGMDFCFVPCNEEGATQKSCAVDSYGYDNAVVSTCTKGDDGNLYWVEESEECDHACDPNTFECTKIVEGEGEPCDEDYVAHCDNNARVLCSESSTGELVVSASECGDDLICVEDAEGPTCLAPCTDVGEEVSECANWFFFYGTSKYECQALEAGNFYVETDFVTCTSGCNADGTACEEGEEPPVVTEPEDLGQPCDSDTFVERCDNNWMVFCEDGKVEGIHCGDYEGLSCSVVTGENATYAYCFGEEDRCETAGEISKVCRTVSGYLYSYVFVCLSTADGSNSYNLPFGRVPCSSSCDEETGSCTKLVADEGDPCDSLDMQDECRDNILVYCYDDAITALDCSSYNASCKLSSKIYDGDLYGDCVARCEAATEVTNHCAYNNYYDMYVVTRSVCDDIDGTLYQFDAIIKGCESCNAAGTDCAE